MSKDQILHTSYRGVEVEMNSANYNSPESVAKFPGSSVALAVAAPMLMGAHLAIANGLGTIACNLTGITKPSHKMFVTGTFVIANLYLMNMFSEEMISAQTLNNLSDAYTFTGNLIGQVVTNTISTGVEYLGDSAESLIGNIL